MNTKTIILVLALVAFATAQLTPQICSASGKCAGLNQACGTSIATNGDITQTECNQGLYCYTTGSSTGLTGTCVGLTAVGGNCSFSNNNCGVGLACNFTQTTSGVCASVTFNAASGATCDSFNNCKGGLFCSAGTCTALPAVSATCTSVCAGAATCLSGTCVKWGTVAAGSTCHNPQDCQQGLYCSDSTNQCTKTFSSSNTDCSAAPQTCSVTDEVCTCASAGSTKITCQAPQALSSGELNDAINLANCYNTNCGGVFGTNFGACAACKNQLCSLNSDERPSGVPGCFSDYKDVCGSSAATFSASIVLAIVAVFLAL